MEVLVPPLIGTEVVIEEGAVVSMSTETTPDCRRWAVMPSISEFASSLIVLNLHKARYIDCLHSSVCQLTMLKKLVLTHCDRLTTLPADIGNLKSLEEVSLHQMWTRQIVRVWTLLCLTFSNTC